MELILEIGSYVFWILLALTILVFVHEMGHFLAAKFFGMKVDRFSVGFPPKVYGKQIGETEYCIGATPLGGYVKIAGMVDESLDKDQIESEPDERDFRAKPVWQRIVVITAGVIFNVILAFVIFFGLKLAYGETYYPAENVESVYVADSSLAYRTGFRTGDRLLAVNGAPIRRFSNVRMINPFDFSRMTMDRMRVSVVRDGVRITLQAPEDLIAQLKDANGIVGISALPPIVGQVEEGSHADSLGLHTGDRIIAIGGRPVNFFGELTAAMVASHGPITVRWHRPDSLLEDRSRGNVFEGEFIPTDTTEAAPVLGVTGAGEPVLAQLFGRQHERLGVGQALVSGVGATWTFTDATITAFGRMFTGQDDFTESVGGPVAIAKITKNAADAGAFAFWQIVAFLSITLAIINILPIPALDGGHLMFLIYEGITRREPSLKFRMAMQQVGMLLLLVFMVFVIFNDIVRL